MIPTRAAAEATAARAGGVAAKKGGAPGRRARAPCNTSRRIRRESLLARMRSLPYPYVARSCDVTHPAVTRPPRSAVHGAMRFAPRELRTRPPCGAESTFLDRRSRVRNSDRSGGRSRQFSRQTPFWVKFLGVIRNWAVEFKLSTRRERECACRARQGAHRDARRSTNPAQVSPKLSERFRRDREAFERQCRSARAHSQRWHTSAE